MKNLVNLLSCNLLEISTNWCGSTTFSEKIITVNFQERSYFGSIII